MHRALQTVTDELAAEGADPASIVAALTEVAVKPRGRAGNMARPAWRPPGAVLLAAGQSVRDGELAKVFWESLADC